jgi:glycosyltransferase involved in cell wall biosynthesis
MGNGELLEDAKALVKKLDIEDMVIWSGFRQDMPHVLNAMDIYTHLHGKVTDYLLEAMAMAKPIVATE